MEMVLAGENRKGVRENMNDSSRCRNGGSAKKDDFKVGHWRLLSHFKMPTMNLLAVSVGSPILDSLYKK